MKSILRIGEILKDKGITSKDFAEQIGVNAAYLSQVVNNHKFPRKEMLITISEALDVDVRDLFYSSKKAGQPIEALREIKRITDQALEQG